MAATSPETEAIGLCICIDALNDIVNKELLEVRWTSQGSGQAEIYFHTGVHQQVFLLRVIDLVKERADSNLIGFNGSCLDALRQFCESRNFDIDGSITPLRNAVSNINGWLNQEVRVKLWLPTLNLNANIACPRIELLKISGAQSKHNVARLTAVSKGIWTLLSKNGHNVDQNMIPLALDDFREHLHSNFFIYYGTWIAELLNDLRWGLHSYLLPTFDQSLVYLDDERSRYRYEIPEWVSTQVGKEWFWRLMNNVRSRPYLEAFRGTDALKKESSLEWRD